MLLPLVSRNSKGWNANYKSRKPTATCAVVGLLDYFTGRFFYQTTSARCDSAAYRTCLQFNENRV